MADGWTCPECGLSYEHVSPADAAVAARSWPRRFAGVVRSLDGDEDADALIRRRPEPSTWSALEYVAHTADSVDAIATIVRRMSTEDSPTLEFWDPDERAASERYGEQPLDAVLDRLQAASEHLAAAIESVDAGDWRRTAMFPWGERDTLTMARNGVHEGYHHLRDTARVLTAVRGRPTEPA